MRARLALHGAGIQYELREVLIRDKPREMLELSPKGTVPVLSLPDGHVIDESLDIISWALAESDDPQRWLSPLDGSVDDMLALIQLNDGKFKCHLDHYKYPERFEPYTPACEHFRQAYDFLHMLEQRLKCTRFLFGSKPALADAALFPFIRQFAAVDQQAFEQLPLFHLQRWLARWLSDPLFRAIMIKYKPWQQEEAPVVII